MLELSRVSLVKCFIFLFFSFINHGKPFLKCHLNESFTFKFNPLMLNGKYMHHLAALLDGYIRQGFKRSPFLRAVITGQNALYTAWWIPWGLITKRFTDKGYLKSLTERARKKASNLSQAQCLAAKSANVGIKQEIINFITTYYKSHNKIQRIFRKHWYILKKDPYLSKILPEQQQITYRWPPTLKPILAPSKLHRHRGALNIEKNERRIQVWPQEMPMLFRNCG